MATDERSERGEIGDTFIPQRRHRAVYEVSPEIIVALCQPGRRTFRVVENALPYEATVYGIQYDAIRDVWRIGLEHESFPECAEGAIPITLRPAVVINELPDDEDDQDPTDA